MHNCELVLLVCVCEENTACVAKQVYLEKM